MKLKFRADSTDVIVFLMFSVLLFYMVGIGVLNVSSFSSKGTYHGFNPMPIFTKEFFAPTMVFFLLILIIILTSVSSYFFERKKGVGFEVGPKVEKGYARWAKEKEIKKELKLVRPHEKETTAAGIPLINNGKEIWVDDGEYHNLIIGSTGSGKTQSLVHPLVKLLAKKGESMIVTDPKGEIYEENANLLRERGYNIVLLNFRVPHRGNAWNPLHLPYTLYKNGNQDKANELVDDLALNILYDENAQQQDPFWERSAADYFGGLALSLFEDAKPSEVNLNSINYMATIGEDKYLGSNYIKTYFGDKDPTSGASISVSGIVNAPSETKGGILSVFKQKVRLFTSRENIAEMLSYSDFDMKDIGRKKTAVFLVIQDEKKTYHSLLTIFIKQCYETLIDVAQECGGGLPFRTNFILDEFANMPPLKDVTTMVTAARSRNIRFNFIIQNFSQLYQVYGKENGETIKGNCGNLFYLISTELSALEEISKLCGEVKSKEKDKTASTPLVTISDLQNLKISEIIIRRIRMMPFKTKLIPNYKMNWGENLEKSDYPTREKRTIEVFDLKKYVEDKKKKVFESAGNIMGQDFGGIFGGQPTKPSKDLNMDDLIKKIDQKIAELEEEERQEKLKEAESSKEETEEVVELEKPITPPKPKLVKPMIDIPIAEEEEIEKEVSLNSKIEKNIDDISITEKKPLITDDQFFDDFFGND